ncbi:hypothetical protein [Rubellimicrobium sp. CFH 75288]|uniref:hypothetical protein n=1 Tax=Rubellimicrobium sp. CFH 75288 TaxID=2697034 RepID=UPI001FB573E5|nr:hypothetical protein [Rubellimicrobium sp. CFH 75288]
MRFSPLPCLGLVALLAGAAGAAALPWDGTYRPTLGADCSRIGEEGGAVRIAEGEFHGIGAVCEMTNPVDVLDMDATLYVMECEGGGETWTERAMLMRAAEGDAVFVIWNGYAFRYERCPDPAEEAADEPAAPEVPGAPDGEAPVL